MVAFNKIKLEVILLLFLAANFYLIFFVFHFNQPGDDYIYEIRYFAGDKSIVIDSFPKARVFLRPLVPAVGALLTNFTDPFSALLAQDIFYYFLTPFLLYFAALLLFKDKKISLYAAIFYAGSYPYLKFTLNYMTDVAAWFFQVLSIFLTLKYLSIYKSDKKLANGLLILTPWVCFLGSLAKESGAVGIIFFILAILLATDYKFKVKMLNLAMVGAVIFILLASFQLIINYKFGHNFFEMFSYHQGIYADKSHDFFKVIKKIAAVFSFGWILVVFGFYKLLKAADKTTKLAIFSLIPPSLIFLIWPYQAERLIFVAGPLLAFLAAYGLNSNKTNISWRFLEIIPLVFFVVVNYCLDYIIKII